jgi:hypothetical protein
VLGFTTSLGLARKLDRIIHEPPRKNLLLISNGLTAKAGMRHARREGEADRLARLAAAKETCAAKRHHAAQHIRHS